MITVKNLLKTGLFSSWKDPVSEVESFILAQRIAPVQQSFYFLNKGFTISENYLWFYCAFPPSGDHNYGRMLGVMDLNQNDIRYYPETQFSDGSPLVDEITGEVYWVSNLDIWKRGPLPTDKVIHVNRFPEKLARKRRPYRISTHLTFSADRKSLGLDAQIGEEWFIGDIPLDGSSICIWQTFSRCFNHGQFSPVDPNLQLIAQDWWIDPLRGEVNDYENRIWLIRKGMEAQPLFQGNTRQYTHEWWDASGKFVWYVDYMNGTEKINIETGEYFNIWPGGTCHSHSDRSGRFLVGDIGTYQWNKGCRVAFYNTLTKKEIDIVTQLPLPNYDRGLYHIDPHPQFCGYNDQWVCYTTTVEGMITPAMTRTERLIDITS